MEVLAQSWLDQQCKLIQGVTSGVLMLGVPENDSFSPVACWPEGNTTSPTLLAVARTAMEKKQGVVTSMADNNGASQRQLDTIGYPLVIKDQLVGIVALEIDNLPEASRRSVTQLLKLGTVWLEMLIDQHTTTDKQNLITVLELVALSLEHKRFQAAATSLVTELAMRMGCNRASIGFLHGERIQLQAMSHSARIDTKTNLARDIAAAMEEAIDQDMAIAFPVSRDKSVHITRAHEELVRQHGNGAICTIPLVDDGAITGALTLERSGEQPFDIQTVELFKQIGAMVGPTLELKRRDDRWLISKAGESLHSMLGKLLGPRHIVMKFATAASIALVVFMAVVDGRYRVTADAALEGQVQRAVVAPIDGYINSSDIRAGDIVHTGQLMGELDDKDLRLEYEKLSSEKNQYIREHRSALAGHERAETSILSAQIDQVSARLRLVEEQLERLHIVSPFDGVVVSGDLSQSLGSPVERGDVLFEVAPLDAYRLVLKVDENDIREIDVGQTGKLRLSGMPGETLPFSIGKITPVSEATEGSNFFRVEARLESEPAQLRPGMEGVAKVEIGERKLAWVWTHKLIDWLRLWAWSWWP
ncbi:MAG: HlyD family efflux transporter periplasmic adaptor subunit [Halobacteria archaeon]|nr:HlyD family efflux transporter periplasmic adaptor subunit [Halobacteria archaeon]